VQICLRNRLALPARFARAARRYWLGVFPTVREEVLCWRLRAQQIPDPLLRSVALQMQQSKVGNVEGAAAYGAFACVVHRSAVVRAQVAFQTAYDYADALSERGSEDPVANGQTLHRALRLVAEAAGPHVDYYAHCDACDDGGYLRALSDALRGAFDALPARAQLAAPLERAVARIVAYQARNHMHPEGMHLALAGWARRETPAGTGLRWWETAASAGSSTGIFSYIAAAADSSFDGRHSRALESAYFPWAGSLHTLLDSLVDRHEDAASGQRSLLDYYRGAEEARARMGLIATEAVRQLRKLPDGESQLMVFAAMASLYVSSVRSASPADHAISGAVLSAIGGPVMPALFVFALRRALSRKQSVLASGQSSESCSCLGEGCSGASDARGLPRLAQWPITWWLRQLW
jgi:tetraprenyl-beta-curcumene synthase